MCRDHGCGKHCNSESKRYYLRFKLTLPQRTSSGYMYKETMRLSSSPAMVVRSSSQRPACSAQPVSLFQGLISRPSIVRSTCSSPAGLVRSSSKRPACSAQSVSLFQGLISRPSIVRSTCSSQAGLVRSSSKRPACSAQSVSLFQGLISRQLLGQPVAPQQGWLAP